MRLQIVARTGHPGFLDLPWHVSLASWTSERLVEVPRGIHRHVVRFVSYGERLYALKELPVRLAEREYRLLQALREESVAVVEVVGVVSGRSTATPGSSARGEPLDAVLDHAAPGVLAAVPHALHRARVPNLRDRLLDALVRAAGPPAPGRLLLGRLLAVEHAVPPRRRRTGRLPRRCRDRRTAPEPERRAALARSRHRRGEHRRRAVRSQAGGLGCPRGSTRSRSRGACAAATRRLWQELTQRGAVPARRAATASTPGCGGCNELGFDVDEVELEAAEGGYRLRLEPRVVEPGHHRRRLLTLTGLDVQENQARRLLNDMASFRAQSEHKAGRALPPPVVAYKWLAEVFEPTIAAVPPSSPPSWSRPNCSTRFSSTAGSCPKKPPATSASPRPSTPTWPTSCPTSPTSGT